MTAHIVVLLLLLPLATAIALYVAWPLLQRRRGEDGGLADAAGEEPTDAQRREAVNRAVVRERRAQLDADLAALPADSPERARLIEEFSDAALQDLGGAGGGAGGSDGAVRHAPVIAVSSTRPARVLGAVAAALLIAVPLAFYGLRGQPGSALSSLGLATVKSGVAESAGGPANGAAQADGEAEESGMTPDQIDELVSQLETRLKQDPSNVEGWLLLGRTRLAMGDGKRAVDAFEQALKLDSPSKPMAAQIRTDLADALGRLADARLDGRPWELVQKALELDGNNLKALGLAGAYQITRGNREGALKYWEPLVDKLPADSPQREQLAALVSQMRAGRMPSGLGGPDTSSADDTAASTTPGPAEDTEGNGARPSSAPSTSATPAAAASVRGSIDVAPAVRATVDSLSSGGATLFIAARRVDADGRPVGPPAAAIRGPLPSTWPLKFELGAAEAMMPANALKAGDRVIIVARVSASGSATRSTGDVEGSSAPLVVGDDPEAVVRIEHAIP